MNAICAAGARTAAERPATTAAPLKAGAWKGSRRYIICAGHRAPTGGQASRWVPHFCLHVCPACTERRGAWTWHTSEMLDLWIKLGEYNQLALVLVLKKTRQAGGRRVAKHRQKSLSVRNNGNGLGFAGK
jgi:hypothetical protein